MSGWDRGRGVVVLNVVDYKLNNNKKKGRGQAESEIDDLRNQSNKCTPDDDHWETNNSEDDDENGW